MSDIIRLTDVECGVNNNHITFKGFIPRKDPNFKYTFDFIGVEITVNTYLPEAALKQLKEELVKDYGHAPFNIDKVKEVFGEGKDYIVDSVVGA